MITRVPLIALVAVAATALCARAHAQDTIKIGELNSYKSQPAFLEPYKHGIELAVDEINKSGGVLGKKLDVISRTVETLLGLVQTRSSLRVEWYIVLLIVAELLLTTYPLLLSR